MSDLEHGSLLPGWGARRDGERLMLGPLNAWRGGGFSDQSLHTPPHTHPRAQRAGKPNPGARASQSCTDQGRDPSERAVGLKLLSSAIPAGFLCNLETSQQREPEEEEEEAEELQEVEGSNRDITAITCSVLCTKTWSKGVV